MVLSKRVSWFLVAFGVWSWIIWPTFLKNIWADPRSWHHGMTGFFAVHLVLTVVSLALGTVVGLLGVRGVRGRQGQRVDEPVTEPADTGLSRGGATVASASNHRR